MKSITKNIVTFSLLFFSVFSSYSQNTISKEKVVAVQAGTVHLNNGKADIILNDQTMALMAQTEYKPSYFVALTPVGHRSSLVIANKGNNSVKIEGDTDTDVEFIVYVKRTFVIDKKDLDVTGTASY